MVDDNGVKPASIEDADDLHRETLKNTGYWGKQGAGCLILSRSTGRFLVPLRSAHVEQPGTWGTLGGAIDPGEDPQDAACREAREESGFDGEFLEVKPLYVFEADTDDGGKFRYNNYLVVIENEFTAVTNWETERFVWVDFAGLKALKKKHFGLKRLLKHSGEELKAAAAVPPPRPLLWCRGH